ncbi:hypothetical protein ES703_89112 [subsurface metagenome]
MKRNMIKPSPIVETTSMAIKQVPIMFKSACKSLTINGKKATASKKTRNKA